MSWKDDRIAELEAHNVQLGRDYEALDEKCLRLEGELSIMRQQRDDSYPYRYYY